MAQWRWWLIVFGLPSIEPIYMDYAATTPVDAAVTTAMASCLELDGDFGNASSTHVFGAAAADRVAKATQQLAASLNAKPADLVWTSGATESDNLAIIGAARYRKDEGRHLITARTEHKAVVDAFRYLEREGFDVTWLNPEPNGLISPAAVESALRPDTTLVSIMWVNNELGTINDIAAMAQLLSSHPALFHVDAAQAFGKLPIDVQAVPIDLLSLTAHKIYGPKGIGALFLAPRLGVNIEPLLYGGGQQNGRRPGTMPTHQIVGFGAAADIAMQRMAQDHQTLSILGELLRTRLTSIDGVSLNGSPSDRLTWLLNVSVDGVDGEALVAAMLPVALATGSACNSKNTEPSFVLRAIGLDDQAAGASLRFSLGRQSTEDDVHRVADHFERVVTRLRQIAGPLGRVSA
ncbi:MAG: cysteine desulfurase family protein [Woeseiaceae bacterium]